MNGAEPTLTEQAPVPLALARVERGPKAPPRVRRAPRPSLPLMRLEETVVLGITKLQDCDDNIESTYEIVDHPIPVQRRASAAPGLGRPPAAVSIFLNKKKSGDYERRASLAVPDDKVRRRSWAQRLQLERKKRAKSGGDGEVETVDEDEVSPTPVSPGSSPRRRQSWWNVLVPDNILKNRSRRASQQLSRSDESIAHAQTRSKSRSVDHGFAAPFDLETLRSKVESRFDSVQREEEESSKRSSVSSQSPPIKTINYVVHDRDTLTSLAARFDTTPSELTKLNRLATPYVFPGQNLLVPDKSKDGDKDSDAPSESGDANSESTEPQEKELLDNLRPGSPEAPSSPAAPQRFLKINVRHITDGQGVVSGVLLVTPNAVMFDPNVSDFLVIEHGPELYGVIAPMEFVVNAAIYYDIAHMRTHDSDPNATIKGEKPEIYYMNKSNPEDKDSTLVKDETFSELHETTVEGKEEESEDTLDKDKGEDSREGSERGGDAFPKAFDRELVTPTGISTTAEERRRSMLDHHWAIPLKERNSLDMASEVSSTADQGREDSTGEGSSTGAASNSGSLAPPGGGDLPSLHLVKLSCHDSGIDIRDPMMNIPPTNTKKVYSDADIVLSQDWVPPVTIAPAEPPLSAPPTSTPGDRTSGRKPGSVSFSLDSTSGQDSSSGKDDVKGEKKNKMLKRLSYPLSWMEGLTGDNTAPSTGSQGDSLPNSGDSHNSGSVFLKVFNSSPMNLVELGTGLFLSKTPSEEAPQDSVFQQAGRSSLGGFGRPDTKKSSVSSQSSIPKLDYRSMVSVDDMPELFVSFDKLIPRLARSCNDPPLYLRLRMGRPIGRALPRTTPLMSYGKKRMQPEYWFSVPRNRVDDLFKFLNYWVPDRYGEIGDVVARGYQLVDSDTDWDDEEDGPPREKGEQADSNEVGDLTRESWEVLSMSDEVRRALYSSGASIDMEFSPPDLLGNTEILTMDHREKICNILPARAQGYMWSLVFNSSQHGFSLASMYRKMQRVDSPVLLVIQDTDNNVFGALTSKALHPSEHFYGTGESFLFSFAGPNQPPSSPTGQAPVSPSKRDILKSEEGVKSEDSESEAIVSEVAPPASPVKTHFRYWQWTGDNMYFIKGSNDNISIGAGDGKFGLWLDGDLYLGRTQCCKTYGNEPLTTREDFIVKILECWAFI